MRQIRTIPQVSFAVLLAVLLAAPAFAGPVVLRGATIHTVSGVDVPGGTLVLDGGKIVALGSDVEIPAGAEVIDLDGKHVYPGFFQSLSSLGLTEIDSVQATVDLSEMGEVNSDLRAEVAVNADSLLLPVAVTGGVLTAHVALRGGAFTGTSAVLALRGWNWEDMTIRGGVGMHLRYPQVTPGPRAKEEELKEIRGKAMKTLDDTLDRARDYRRARQAGGDVGYDAKLEALLGVLDATMPLFLWADEKNQIESALDWTAEQGFENVVLVTGPDAAYVAKRLAEEQVPVILDGVLRLPSRRWEPYDASYTAAARLHEAGVRFAINDGGGASDARNLPFHAAMAASFGLPKDVALRSVTLAPAEILGVADRLGSLDVGKDATLIVTDGDPLEIVTRIERVWIRGEEVDLSEDPQRRLYEKYDNRPRPAED